MEEQKINLNTVSSLANVKNRWDLVRKSYLSTGTLRPPKRKPMAKGSSFRTKVKKEEPNEDHDYAPKKPKKTKKKETPKRPIKTEKADKTTSNQNRRKTRSSQD